MWFSVWGFHKCSKQYLLQLLLSIDNSVIRTITCGSQCGDFTNVRNNNISIATSLINWHTRDWISRFLIISSQESGSHQTAWPPPSRRGLDGLQISINLHHSSHESLDPFIPLCGPSSDVTKAPLSHDVVTWHQKRFLWIFANSVQSSDILLTQNHFKNAVKLLSIPKYWQIFAQFFAPDKKWWFMGGRGVKKSARLGEHQEGTKRLR